MEPELEPASPRRAVKKDVPALVGLRRVLLTAMAGGGRVLDDWEAPYAEMLADRLGDPGFAVFIVDGDGGPVACGIGVVEHLLPGPGNPTGRRGHLLGMATAPQARGEGHARRIVAALMAWFRASGITRVELNATHEGEALYRSFGFAEPPFPALTWRG